MQKLILLVFIASAILVSVCNVNYSKNVTIKEELNDTETVNTESSEYDYLSDWFEIENITAVIKHPFEDKEVAVVSIKDNSNKLENYFIVIDENGKVSEKYSIPDNTMIMSIGVEKVKDGYNIVLISKNQHQITLRTYLSIKNSDIIPLRIDFWGLESDYNNLEHSFNELQFSLSNSIEFYDGPTGVLLGIEVNGENKYSLVSNYYEDNKDKEKSYTVHLCHANAQSFLIRNRYYRNLYDANNIDYFDRVDLSDEMIKDETLINILTENLDLLTTKYWRVLLPKDYIIISYDTGDINSDGYIDHGIAIERLPGLFHEERMIFVFLSNGEDEFTVLRDVNYLALGAYEGGILGDPFSGLSMKDDILTIENYGGSSDRWGHKYLFKVIEDKLQLIESRYLVHNTNTGSGIETINDYLTGTSNRYSYSYEEEFDGLLISSVFIEQIETMYFDVEFSSEKFISNSYDGIEEPLPSLYGIPYGQKYWQGELRLTSEKILDYVADSLYSDLVKTQYSYSDDTLEIYSKLLSYEMPRYFYKSDEKILWYGGIILWRSNDITTHRLYIHDKELNQTTEITLYIDDEGKIKLNDYE